MFLTKNQIDSYSENGFLLLENQFTEKELQQLTDEVPGVMRFEQPGRILEKNGTDVRSIFAAHEINPVFQRFSKLDKLVKPATELLNSPVYIYQTKLNSKRAFNGDVWDWHQDFPYWHLEDGIAKPEIITAMIYLNEVTEFNGPMYLVPGSHRPGIASFEDFDEDANIYDKVRSEKPKYLSHLTANLKYTISKDALSEWISWKGIFSAKAPAGSVLFFHGNVFHSSPNNLSNVDRNAFLITYNSVANFPPKTSPRPAFLCSRSYEAIEPITA
jgi:ectoine hydroxylase